MFEHLFKEYLSRAEAMHNEQSLLFAYIIANIFLGTAFGICAFLFFYFRLNARFRTLDIYMPLGFLFTSISCICAMNIYAIWHNYAWITALLYVIASICGVWTMLSLPKAIKQRRLYDECHEIKEKLETLEQLFKESKGNV